MPQNKPMKMQWIQVDGRPTPLTLPQVWSHEKQDWVITSDQDPLPVVEYGTTEGGIIIPKRVSDEGAQHTQLTGSNTAKEPFVDVEITAGSNISTDIERVSASKIGIGVRWREPTVFRLNFRPRVLDPSGVVVDETYTDAFSGTSASVEYFPKLPRLNIRIFNDSDEDKTLWFLTLTYFN